MATKLPLDQIICADALQSLKQIPEQSVDLIFADPPYFMQTSGQLIRPSGQVFNGVDDAWDKFASFADYDKFSLQWLTECKRILKVNGAIAVIGSFQNIYRLGYLMQNLGFWVINDIVWHKSNPVPNFNGTRFVNAHETILLCAKDRQSKITFNYQTMKHYNGGKQDKSVWTLPLCTGRERLVGQDGKKLHSTQKPLELIKKIVLATTKVGDVVLDPFFGTGTTGHAAKLMGRHFIGIERETIYCKAALERIGAIEYEVSPIYNLDYEIKPPKVAMATLIDAHLLILGEPIYFSTSVLKGDFRPQNLVSGHLQSDGKIASEDGKTYSIHKWAAKMAGKISANGWDYLYVVRHNCWVSINELRFKYKDNQELKKPNLH